MYCGRQGLGQGSRRGYGGFSSRSPVPTKNPRFTLSVEIRGANLVVNLVSNLVVDQRKKVTKVRDNAHDKARDKGIPIHC